VPPSGRLVVDESPIRLEVRCRNGGDLLSDGDLDELVALARSEGSNRKPASYHTRRREAFEHVDTMRRTLIVKSAVLRWRLPSDDTRPRPRQSSRVF
jgi:hypothetical protein